jgi:processive 1,2-diacylglycerol beta-glucosyltransferase
MKTRVLILHTSVGYGIKITAEYIFAKLRTDEKFDVRIEDIQEVERGWINSITQKIYVATLDHMSGLWGFLYSSKVVLWLVLPLRKFVASFKHKKTLEILRQFQPAIVISTQAAPTGIIAYLKSKGLYRGKLVAAFSDYHLHDFWLFNEVDLYACNIKEQADILLKAGVEKSRVAVTGFPLPEKFFQPIIKETALEQAGFLKSMPVVLLTSGGRARTAIKEIFFRLLRSNKSFQVVMICGKNEELKQELEKVTPPVRHPTKVFGYVNNMDVLMSAATVMVGKTGGPTMAEAVAKKLPMVLTDVRPGHEQANLDFLVKNNVAVYGRIPAEVVFLVEEILDGKSRIDLLKAFETIIKPPGSIEILDVILRICPNEFQG